MVKRFSPPFLGFLQATGLVIYIVLIAFFLNSLTPNFNNDMGEFFAPIIMLLVFTISAVISALLVLGRAGVLFWEKKYKESFKLVAFTLGWGLFYLVLFIIALSVI